MTKKLSNYLSIVLPNKKINLFTIGIILLGIVSGSIFLVILSSKDKELIINKISTFMASINENKINNINALKNSLIENSIYVILMWIFGLSIIGIIINIFLTYLKGFITGFTIGSFILTYKYEGIVASLIYTFPTTIINLLITIIISVYSFTMTVMLLKSIFNKNNSFSIKKFVRKYILVLLISMGMVLISSLSESFILPSLMKLVIKLFI